jgi:predicted metal-dependent HD superfamily phosphohydrolase
MLIICEKYEEQNRYYYTLNHIFDLLKLKDYFMNPLHIKDNQCLELAIFFHDIIYIPQSLRNEEDSANVFDSLFDHGAISKELKKCKLIEVEDIFLHNSSRIAFCCFSRRKLFTYTYIYKIYPLRPYTI